jgi:hypothetical protein
VLTQRRGGNPNLWLDVKKVLPLLARYEYYSTLKRGFCRGGEALVLTENIRNYFDILVRFEDPHTPGLGNLLAGGGNAREDAHSARTADAFDTRRPQLSSRPVARTLK